MLKVFRRSQRNLAIKNHCENFCSLVFSLNFFSQSVILINLGNVSVSVSYRRFYGRNNFFRHSNPLREHFLLCPLQLWTSEDQWTVLWSFYHKIDFCLLYYNIFLSYFYYVFLNSETNGKHTPQILYILYTITLIINKLLKI